MGKLIADWMTDGRTAIDHTRIDYARFYPHQLQEKFIEDAAPRRRGRSTIRPVHPREPFAGGPRRQALALPRAREGAGRLLHGARRLGAGARLRRQRAPAGKVWRPRSGTRERVGQPALLARLQCRASGDERGLRHRQPLALPHGATSRGRTMSSCWNGSARPRSAATAISARASTPTSSTTRAWCAPTSPSSAWPTAAAWSTAPTPVRATSTTCGAWREDRGFDVTITDVTREVRHHRHLGAERAHDAAEGRRGSGWPRSPENFPFAAIKQIQIARQDGHRLPHLLCRRAGLGTAHEV